MSWWAWYLLGVATLPALLVLACALEWLLSPGRGWTLRCGFGNYPHGMPQYGPRCTWGISANRYFPPEWTKSIRFRWHWWRSHPVSKRRYQRDYLEWRNRDSASQFQQ